MKKNNENLKRILNLVSMEEVLFNEANPTEKVELIQKMMDVRYIFVCAYDDDCVGLFEKIDWCKNRSKYRDLIDDDDYVEDFIDGKIYDAGSIYVGVGSDYIGMKLTHDYNISVDKWLSAGVKEKVKGQKYVSNCVIKGGMSFDDMRLIMYSDGQIGPYELGKATSEEILEVLKYARSYYEGKKAKQKVKK